MNQWKVHNALGSHVPQRTRKISSATFGIRQLITERKIDYY